ncbi:MAG: hypothetical protein A4E28_00204 [Methanocella sp. PtaU1.Bin125]|nr:MAG: hypothetical protein A4E28_00204 [Methanocella sp. PtaU1.Bin125]
MFLIDVSFPILYRYMSILILVLLFRKERFTIDWLMPGSRAMDMRSLTP